MKPVALGLRSICVLAVAALLSPIVGAVPCVDGDGDGYVDCRGTGAGCVVQPGQTCGDCNDGDPAIHPGASDATCNGVDEDCDLNDGPPPTVHTAGLRVLVNKSDLAWDALAGATVYDVVKGDLIALRESGGNFTASLRSCVENCSPDILSSDPGLPAAGGGFYYLVRHHDACENRGSYDEGSSSQIGSRDAEINDNPSASCVTEFLCAGDNPALGHCTSSVPCSPEICIPPITGGCTPSACYCGRGSGGAGQWLCTYDCLGHCG